jgi:hypothetical protein
VTRAPIACPRCGAAVDAEQGWCLECGLAARTRLAPTPNWRAPLIAAGAVGLAAIAALVIAFLVLTGDNAPLPTTAAPAPATAVTTATDTATVATPTTPDATTTEAIPGTTIPTTPTVPEIPTVTTPAP